MYLRKRLEGGEEATIIVRHNTRERLKDKCFRGTTKKLAGNFSRWASPQDLFSDELVLQEFLADMDVLWRRSDFRTHSLTITHHSPVGWGSTDDIRDYCEEDLEAFSPSRRSSALRVKLGLTMFPAPRTQELTIVFEFRSEDDRPVAVVHSIYPGPDVGELVGDVSRRERRVFFDWNHPGQ